MEIINRELKQKEIEANFEVFQKNLKNIIQIHQGEFALMKNKEIVGFFSTFIDAEKAGRLLDENCIFSIQKVDDSIVNLGIFSYI